MPVKLARENRNEHQNAKEAAKLFIDGKVGILGPVETREDLRSRNR